MLFDDLFLHRINCTLYCSYFVLLAIVPVDVLLESSAISTLFYYYIVLFILCFVWNGAVMYLYNSHHVRLSVTFT